MTPNPYWKALRPGSGGRCCPAWLLTKIQGYRGLPRAPFIPSPVSCGSLPTRISESLAASRPSFGGLRRLSRGDLCSAPGRPSFLSSHWLKLSRSADEAVLGEGDERHEVAGRNIAHILGDVDEAVGGAQTRDEPRAVARELVHGEALRRLLEDAAPELAAARLAPGKCEQGRQLIAPGLGPIRPAHAAQKRPDVEQEADENGHWIAW